MKLSRIDKSGELIYRIGVLYEDTLHDILNTFGEENMTESVMIKAIESAEENVRNYLKAVAGDYIARIV